MKNFHLNQVDIEGEKETENLHKAFLLSQAIIKSVKRKNREIQLELQESEKEVQRSAIKSIDSNYLYFKII